MSDTIKENEETQKKKKMGILTKIALSIGGAIALIVVGAIIYISTLDLNKFKPKIESLVSDKGYELKINGDIEAGYFPLRLETKDLLLKVPNREDWIELKALSIALEPIPLLSGIYDIDYIKIIGLDINVSHQKIREELQQRKNKAKPKKKKFAIAKLNVKEIIFEDFNLRLVDDVNEQVTKIERLNVNLKNLDFANKELLGFDGFIQVDKIRQNDEGIDNLNIEFVFKDDIADIPTITYSYKDQKIVGEATIDTDKIILNHFSQRVPAMHLELASGDMLDIVNADLTIKNLRRISATGSTKDVVFNGYIKTEKGVFQKHDVGGLDMEFTHQDGHLSMPNISYSYNDDNVTGSLIIDTDAKRLVEFTHDIKNFTYKDKKNKIKLKNAKIILNEAQQIKDANKTIGIKLNGLLSVADIDARSENTKYRAKNLYVKLDNIQNIDKNESEAHLKRKILADNGIIKIKEFRLKELESEPLIIKNIAYKIKNLSKKIDANTTKKSYKSPLNGINLDSAITISSIKKDTVEVSRLKSKVKIRKNDLFFGKMKYKILGMIAKGKLDVNMNTRQPVITITKRYTNVDLERINEFLGVKRSIRGEGDMSLNVRFRSTDPKLIQKTINGDLIFNGYNMTTIDYDIDGMLENYKDTQSVGMIDIGSVVLAGPIGLMLSNGAKGAMAYNSLSGKGGRVKHLKIGFNINKEKIRLDDVAMSTPKNLVALNGFVNLKNKKLEKMTFAILNPNYCKVYFQEIKGTYEKPSIEVGQTVLDTFANIASSVTSWMGSDDDCEVFYKGRVKHPKDPNNNKKRSKKSKETQKNKKQKQKEEKKEEESSWFSW